MASEPYWADAPSRSTSMDSIAIDGMAPMSAPWAPKPPTCISAERCRRLPFINTSVWWVSRPRMCVGLMKLAPSEIGWRRAANDGTMALITSIRSDELTLEISSALNTSTGTAVSTAARSRRRVPIVTISSITRASAPSPRASWAPAFAATSISNSVSPRR